MSREEDFVMIPNFPLLVVIICYGGRLFVERSEEIPSQVSAPSGNLDRAWDS